MDAKLFEIGSTFGLDSSNALKEVRQIGLVASAEFREVRGMIEVLLARLNPTAELRFIPAQQTGFAAGACAKIEWNSEPIGYIGKVDRAIAEGLGLRDLPIAAELNLQPLLDGAQRVRQLTPIPRFPAVRRDLSFVLPEETRFEKLEAVIREVKPAGLEAVEFVTTYRGKPLAAGTKSVTITLVFRSPNATLTGEAAEAAVHGVVTAAQEKLGAVLRV